MAKHTVDTSLNTPPVSVPASAGDRLPRMPNAPGNAKAADPVQTHDAQQADLVGGIARPGVPGVEDLRVVANTGSMKTPLE
jgi:hypothetical protein